MLLRADARHLPLRDGCVQCVITSPPYFGLRDYGTAGQIGLEPTPDAYVSALLAVFADVWRVLRDDGTAWLNLGDCYATGAGRVGEHPSGGAQGDRWQGPMTQPNRMPLPGLKPKDLCGIPWRVAQALQSAGWYLRADIIWAKPNPMPESVTDRPTRSHEYVFLLTKSQRYYYDAAAIAEPVSAAMLHELEQDYNGLGLKDYEGAGVQNPSSVKARIIANARAKVELRKGANPNRNDGGAQDIAPRGFGRNKRSVWTVTTQPYSGSHFATMPEQLIEPCILAGCPAGGLVLDPFFGSGTVGLVAERFDRRWVGCDLRYQDLATERTRQRGLRFAELER